MTVLYLMRHGQASSGQENYDQLSSLGIEQAQRLGQALGHRLPAPEVLITGGMQRHRQTAKHCLDSFHKCSDESGADGATSAHRQQPQENAGWNEYDHQQILRAYRPEYVTVESMLKFIKQQQDPKAFFEREFNAAMKRWMTADNDQAYSESWGEFKHRVHGAYQSLLSEHSDKKSIWVFTSGGPISLITQSLLGLPSQALMRMNWTLINCGVSKIVITPTRQFVASLNEHTHFESAQHQHLISYA